jgi:UDP-glucose 4-epimerase
MANNKILITGVAGMLGSHLLDKLVPLKYEIVGVDNLSVGNMHNIVSHVAQSNFKFFEVDVRDYHNLEKVAGDVDIIVHLAATKKIGEDGNGIDTLTVNTLGTENCLRLAKIRNAKVIFASSSDVYGMSPELPLREDGDLLLGPSMIKRWSYAVSKLYGEQLSFAYYKDLGVPVVILRYFGAFSWRSSFSWSGGHIPVFIDQILSDQAVTIHGDGTQTRSMAAVDDLVEGTYLAMSNDKCIGQIINLGSDEEMSVIDSARLIHQIANTGKELKIDFIPMSKIFGQYRDIQRRKPDLTKAFALLGYKPSISLRDFIAKTIVFRRQERQEISV